MHRLLVPVLLALAACSSAQHQLPDASVDPAGDGGVDAEGTTCNDGERRCTIANEVEECGAAAWHTVEVCPLGCTDGACASATTCAPAARACFGNVAGVCNASGTGWLFEATCIESCTNGLCAGACLPDARRCNAGTVEQCTPDGASWAAVDACAHGCASGQCVLDRLDVTADTDRDGLVIVDGPVNVFPGATLRAPSGFLEIRATSITVDAGGAIVVAPTGNGTAGRGSAGGNCLDGRSSGGGGGHATRGSGGIIQGYTCGGRGGDAFGVDHDLSLATGGVGGSSSSGTVGGKGGGILELYAPTITIAGTLRADGAAATGTGFSETGAGAGGAILAAAHDLAITGTVSAAGGPAGGGQGGLGRIKLLWGSTPTLTGTFIGQRPGSISPPLDPTSITHPDPTRFYNDAFQTFALAWSRPFPSVQGTYWRRDQTPVAPPTPATGTLATGQTIAIARDTLAPGDNYVHLVSIDATTQIGTTESTFRLRLNTAPPALSSPTHPDGSTWSPNRDPLIAWTLPHGDAHHAGVYYVLDHAGRTIPTRSDTFVPVTQHQVLHAGVADGIWALHAISIDHAGNLTRSAAHHVFRVGPDPGLGRVLGQVSGPAGAIANATIEFNRGLIPDQRTNSTGAYNHGTVPAGTWEVTASAPGYQPQSRTVAVTAGGEVTADFQLAP